MRKVFFTIPAKLFMGKQECAFRDSRGNYFSCLRGFATQAGKIPSLILSRWEIGHFPRFAKVLQLTNLGECTNPIIFGIWDRIIPSWAAKRRMKELKIPYESRKVHFNSHASHNFFPMNGLAGVVKKNSTMSREVANGGIFIYHNC